MKKIEIKKPNIDISRRLPQILIGVSLVLGILIVLFAYFIFNRDPDAAVVAKVREEINDISIKFDKKRSNDLFDTSFDKSNIKDPGYPAKNPFLGF